MYQFPKIEIFLKQKYIFFILLKILKNVVLLHSQTSSRFKSTNYKSI